MQTLRPLAALPVAPLLALNKTHARELSEMTGDEFGRYIRLAFSAKGSVEPSALLMAFDHDAPIAGPNFLWFKRRFARFVYIDRVVVGPEIRGRGIARSLYRALLSEARRSGHTCLTCEVNSAPPNPVSDAFHAALGFRVIGSADLADRGKTVQYRYLEIEHA